jgi:hypothetical protein
VGETRSLHEAIGEIILSSKVLSSKPVLTFHFLPLPDLPLFIFLPLYSVLWLDPSLGGECLLKEDCALGTILLYFILFFSFFEIFKARSQICTGS